MSSHASTTANEPSEMDQETDVSSDNASAEARAELQLLVLSRARLRINAALLDDRGVFEREPDLRQ